MKERSVSQRNLLGAFVGGMLGILALGYFNNSLLLIVGCFAGVIGGWWYQEIGQYVVDSFNAGVMKSKEFVGFVFTPVHKLRAWRAELWQDIDNIDAFYYLALFAIPFIWVLRRPAAIILWAREHPGNRAKLVRILAMPVFWAINVAWLIPVGLWMTKEAGRLNHVPAGLFPILGCIVMLVLGLYTIVVPLIARGEADEHPLVRVYDEYQDWNRYVSQGPIGFFFSELAFWYKSWLAASLFMIASAAWFIGAGAVFLGIIGVISGAIGLVKGVYQVSFRTGHWLCFGTTLATTAISASVFHDYLGNVQILWIVALLTGVVAAVATEAARRMLVHFFTKHRSVRALALLSLERQLQPSGRMFMQISTRAGDWFGSYLPVCVQNI